MADLVTTKKGPITFRLPDEEEADFASEAQQMGKSPGDYAKAIVLGRHEQEIVITPDAEKLRVVYETRLSFLSEQNKDLLDRLTARQQQEHLSGIEAAALDKSNKVELTYNQFKKQYEQETLKDRHKELQDQHKILTEKYNELEKEYEELEAEHKQYKSIEGFVEKGVGIGATILEKSPVLQERFANSGLGQLLLGGPVAANLTEEQQQDLQIGTAIREDFPGESFVQVVQLLRFLRDTPKFITALMNGEAFRMWLSRQPQPESTQ